MLDTLGNLGDFIGGIAVVVTLIYLAMQLRQNTRALKAASWQGVVAGARDASRLRTKVANGPAWARGIASYPQMPAEELARFQAVLTDEALFFQGVYALYESNQLDEQVYRAYLNWFCAIMATPGGCEWWRTIGQPIFVPAMVAAVNERLEEGGLIDIRALPGASIEDWEH